MMVKIDIFFVNSPTTEGIMIIYGHHAGKVQLSIVMIFLFILFFLFWFSWHFNIYLVKLMILSLQGVFKEQ